MVNVGDIVKDSRGRKYEVTKIDDRGEFIYYYVKRLNDESEELIFGKKAFNEKFTKEVNND